MKYLLAVAFVTAITLTSPVHAKSGGGFKSAAAGVTKAAPDVIQRDHRAHGGRPGGGRRVCVTGRYCLVH